MPIVLDRKPSRTPSLGIKGGVQMWDEDYIMRLGGSFRRRDDDADTAWRRSHFEVPAPLMSRMFENNPDIDRPSFMNDWQRFVTYELDEYDDLPKDWATMQVTEDIVNFYKDWRHFEDDLELIKDGNINLIETILSRHSIDDKFWGRTPIASQDETKASHQKAGVAFFLRSLEIGGGHICLFDEMRTGKTKQAIDIARYLLKKNLIRRVLVICPNSIKRVWQNELILDAPDYGWLSTIIEGTKAKKERAWKSLGFFYIINYEGARADKEFMMDWQDAHAKDGWMLICDESHKIKNPLAKQTKAIMGLNPDFSILMTGTPVANRPEDAYCMTDFVCSGILGGSLEQFYRRFATRGGYTGKSVTGYHDLDEITYRLERISMRRKRKDVMFDITIKQDRIGELVGDQKKAYEKMRDELWAEIQNAQGDWTTAKAQNGLVKVLRLQQITSGYLPKIEAENPLEQMLLKNLGNTQMRSRTTQTKDDVVWFDDNWKLKELDEFIDEYLDDIGKLVIWSRYIPPLEMLYYRYQKHGSELIRGGMKSDAIFDSMNHFNTDPECKIMVCNILSSEGKGFPAADFHWFWDKWWSPHLNKQAEDRTQGVATIGAEKPTTVISAITKDAIDERLEYILRTKQDWSDQMLGDTNGDIKIPIMDKNSLLYLIAKPEEADKYKKSV